MKNKKTAYIMVPIVLVIWGMIGWKVYAAMKDKDDAVVVNVYEEKIKIISTKISDTISIIADYRDPFLDKRDRPKENSKFNPGSYRDQNSKLAVVKVPVSPKAEPVWPKIVYHGLIKRTNDQKTVGFLSVNDQSYFVRGEEVAGEVLVGKLWKDSAEVMFGKEKKVFRK
jgi:predicted negative regulator of RcsB-dependent stress response